MDRAVACGATGRRFKSSWAHMELNLESPIAQLPRIGKKYFKKFHKLGINTIRDLIYHFPHRYDDFSNIVPIVELELHKTATIQGKILDIKNSRTPRKRMVLTEAIIEDKTGAIKAIWFNQPFLIRNLKKGQQVSLSGKLSLGINGRYISNPSYETMRFPPSQNFGKGLAHTAGLIPVYPETAGITSRLIRYAIKLILPVLNQIQEFLPLEIIRSQGLLPLKTALKEIHFPKSKILAQKARHRLGFDELFLIELSVIRQKQTLQKQKARNILFNKELIQLFVKSLPFELTNDQKIATWDILRDIAKQRPMNRLLNGDVGSGKTVVATIAALETARAGSQVAIMAPTEILAQQHFKEIGKLLRKFNLIIGLLTKSENKIQKEKIYPVKKKLSNGIKRNEFIKKIGQGKIDILIGTHALIQKTVKFKDLALAIVDEQHRFGVGQRALLQQGIIKIKDKAEEIIPHFLTLTATPIPRTLALTAYGDLDISLLKELPRGRQKIITRIIAPANREKSYDFIRQQIEQGRQVFVICPLIEESEKLEVKSVTQEYEKLTKKIFPDLKIAMLHGRMKPREKEQIMTVFKNKKTDILVSTSVVEVGIDVPNATVMMIEGADRFGLAQLHQFRGRVGRGKYQSYCFLFTESSAKTTRARLKALLKCENGFELAEKDLKIRGPGELYGARQSGLPDLAMANLGNLPLIEQTRKEANNLLDKDPELKNYPLLSQKLTQFHKIIHFE